ncbi:MAG: hypothetical protein P8Z00_25025 [Anaerolineales bacterium]|jgi:hypothetical protein
MSGKSLLKVVIAFGLLSVILIFLGVNYVPRISALTSSKENVVDDAKYAGSDYFERHPAAVAESAKGTDSQYLLADNPELSLVRRYAEEMTIADSQPYNNFAANPELALLQRFEANTVESNVPLDKILADNPELSLVKRYAEEMTIRDSQPFNNFAANPELALLQQFAANTVKSEVPLDKTLADNPELILSRRYTQEHNR